MLSLHRHLFLCVILCALNSESCSGSEEAGGRGADAGAPTAGHDAGPLLARLHPIQRLTFSGSTIRPLGTEAVRCQSHGPPPAHLSTGLGRSGVDRGNGGVANTMDTAHYVHRYQSHGPPLAYLSTGLGRSGADHGNGGVANTMDTAHYKHFTVAVETSGYAGKNIYLNSYTKYSNNIINGLNNIVSGDNHVIYGNGNIVSGNGDRVHGNNNVVSGNNNVVVGNNLVVSGNNKVIIQ